MSSSTNEIDTTLILGCTVQHDAPETYAIKRVDGMPYHVVTVRDCRDLARGLEVTVVIGGSTLGYVNKRDGRGAVVIGPGTVVNLPWLTDAQAVQQGRSVMTAREVLAANSQSMKDWERVTEYWDGRQTVVV